MGMGRRHRGCDYYPEPYVKPEEPLYKVRKSIYLNGHTILKVWYKKATNCDGLKIMVYEGKVEAQEPMDPHFRVDGGPIARFHPSQMGWSQAVLFVENL